LYSLSLSLFAYLIYVSFSAPSRTSSPAGCTSIKPFLFSLIIFSILSWAMTTSFRRAHHHHHHPSQLFFSSFSFSEGNSVAKVLPLAVVNIQSRLRRSFNSDISTNFIAISRESLQKAERSMKFTSSRHIVFELLDHDFHISTGVASWRMIIVCQVMFSKYIKKMHLNVIYLVMERDSSGRCVLTAFRVAHFLSTCFEPLFQLFELQSLAKLNNYMKYIEICNRVLIKPIAPGKSYSIVLPVPAVLTPPWNGCRTWCQQNWPVMQFCWFIINYRGKGSDWLSHPFETALGHPHFVIESF